MAQKNISFFECDDESYLIIGHYLSKWYGYEYAYNYYNINANNIILYKKDDNEYVSRYIDADNSIFAPLQIKINNFLGNIHKFKKYLTLMSIESDDKELFKKLREIWNRSIKIIRINNANAFVKTTLDDGSEFIMVDVHENTSFVKGSNSDELVIVLHSVIDNNLKT